jgi:hypothetical protein
VRVLRGDGSVGETVKKGKVGDDSDEPDQDLSDEGADRADGERHGGKQQNTQIRGKIRERVLDVRIIHKSISDKPFCALEPSRWGQNCKTSISRVGAGDKLFVHLPEGLRKGNSKWNERLAGERCGMRLRLELEGKFE